MTLLLKVSGALAAISAPVLLLLGPGTGLLPAGAIAFVFMGLLIIAVTGIGLGAVVDSLNIAIAELRELNAHHNRQWKGLLQAPGNEASKNDSTDEATASS